MLAVTAAAGLVAFIWRELQTEHPVVDLRVFKVRTFAAGVFLMTTLGFVLYGSLVLLPIMLQTLLGYPPVQAGFAMAPRGIGSFLGMPVIGFLIAKVDSRRLVAGGLIVGGFTLLWLGQLNLNAGYWDIFWPQFLQGLGLSMVFVPLTTISMDPIPKERMGNATSLFNLMRNLGGSIGIAATSTMLARRSQSTAAILSDNVTAYNPASRSALAASRDAFIRAGSDPVTATNRAYAAVSGMVHRQATMVAFVEIFTLLGLIFLALVPLVFVMKRPSGRAPAAAH
jgi:DHA2 family multidrug resistance protein